MSFGITAEIALLPERSLRVRYDEPPPCDPANATGHRLALEWLRLARRAGECYNRGVKEQQPTNPEQSTPAEAVVAVYEGMVSAGLTEAEAFRTTDPIRDQAGRNTAEKLESHQRDVETKVNRVDTKVDGVDTKVDRVETKVDRVETKVNRVDTKVNRVDTKVDGVDTKVDRVDTKVGGVETRLTAKIDGVDTKVDRVRTEVKADIAVQGAEVNAVLKAMKRELTIYRWAFLFLIGLLTLLAGLGLADLIERWFD